MSPRFWRRTEDIALLGMAGLLAWQLALYPLTLALLSRLRSRVVQAREEYTPSLTVLVPTYNEAPVVQQRLANLAQSTYPQERLQIVVIDSASTDGTCEQVKAYRDHHQPSNLELVREPERRGKAAALNLGLEGARGDLVVITDALTLFAPDALRRIAANFADSAVGAVSGYFRVPDQQSLAQQEEGLFWELRNRLRLLEAAVDSTPFLSGEFCCFRRPLVRPFPEDTMADDINVAVQVRRSGYRAIVDESAVFWEPRSASFSELAATKTRRAICGLQQLLRARDLWFRPRYGLFGMLILPSAFLYYVPFRGIFLATVAARLVRRAGWPPLLLGGVGVALALRLGGRRADYLLRLLVVAAFNEWVFLRAFVATALGRYSVRWEQERSTREQALLGDVAPATG